MSFAKQKSPVGYGCEDVDPRGFVSLMDLYENNYLRLRRLIPDLKKLPNSCISHRPGCLSLHLTVLERTRFTTTLYLTYYFEEATRSVAEPALTVRLYHDAHQVEIITGHLQHGRQHYDHIPEKTKNIKWKLNRFLYKWLGYCLYLGHTFSCYEVGQPRSLSVEPGAEKKFDTCKKSMRTKCYAQFDTSSTQEG